MSWVFEFMGTLSFPYKSISSHLDVWPNTLQPKFMLSFRSILEGWVWIRWVNQVDYITLPLWFGPLGDSGCSYWLKGFRKGKQEICLGTLDQERRIQVESLNQQGRIHCIFAPPEHGRQQNARLTHWMYLKKDVSCCFESHCLICPQGPHQASHMNGSAPDKG